MQIRISKKLKKASMDVSKKLGFTTSTLIKLFLQHAVTSRRIPFEIEEIPNANFIKVKKQAEINHKNGDYDSFDNVEEVIAFLKKSIKLSKNENRIRSRIQKKIKVGISSYPKKDFAGVAHVQKTS